VIGALVAAAVAGLVLALILSSGGNSSRSRSTPHAVAPPATGANAAEQARALAAWLRSHSH
jgi:Flp pilus assembly protein TadB